MEAAKNRLTHELAMLAFAVALGLLGWGFNAWSAAVETGTNSLLDKHEEMSRRLERNDVRYENLINRVNSLERNQAVIQQRLGVAEEHHRSERRGEAH